MSLTTRCILPQDIKALLPMDRVATVLFGIDCDISVFCFELFLLFRLFRLLSAYQSLFALVTSFPFFGARFVTSSTRERTLPPTVRFLPAHNVRGTVSRADAVRRECKRIDDEVVEEKNIVYRARLLTKQGYDIMPRHPRGHVPRQTKSKLSYSKGFSGRSLVKGFHQCVRTRKFWGLRRNGIRTPKVPFGP